jgi:hypothetical protein
MGESRFEAKVIKTLREMFPGCVILKNDSSNLQGIPDRVIFYNDRWAMLEFKASAKAPSRPNQPYYVDKLNEMSFAAFIYPENEEEVLCALQLALEPCGNSRLPRRQ